MSDPRSPETFARHAMPVTDLPQLPELPKFVERRHHRVYITKNTEYHFRDKLCVAVRDRRTGDFLKSHLALRRRLQGSLRFSINGGIIPNAGDPVAGDALYFANDGRELVTSPIERVDRPPKDVVQKYSNSAHS